MYQRGRTMRRYDSVLNASIMCMRVLGDVEYRVNQLLAERVDLMHVDHQIHERITPPQRVSIIRAVALPRSCRALAAIDVRRANVLDDGIRDDVRNFPASVLSVHDLCANDRRCTLVVHELAVEVLQRV